MMYILLIYTLHCAHVSPCLLAFYLASQPLILLISLRVSLRRQSSPTWMQRKSGSTGQVVVDRQELESKEANDLFTKHTVQLTLTTAYNQKAKGNVGNKVVQ